MKNIPLIDLSPAFTGGIEGERVIASAIDRACKDVGIFAVHGHGISRSVFEDVYRASERFFSLPADEKNRCRLPTGFTRATEDYVSYGYSGLIEENAYAYAGEHGKQADYVETFSVGRLVLYDSMPLPLSAQVKSTELCTSLKASFKASEQLAAKLTELLTLALDLPRDFFAKRTGCSNDSLCSRRYPARSTALENDQDMGAHTDGTLITLLTHTAPDMEFRSRSGKWLTPRLRALDHYIVKIGDLMARWSNDVYVSTPHRAVLSASSRQSIVFFKLADDETLIECFPKFCRDRPAMYEPILYKQFSSNKTNAL
jgi:isopenicillin N synthase-like dioxygenase